ncbi:MAG: PAS domain S-box protein [Candidatus Aureabacteria bacterium]|nr:PAS domain S-box protein [Candidatus Auribacterota bacterium]
MKKAVADYSNSFTRYALALAAIGAAFLLRIALTNFVGSNFPTYITFYPFIMFVAVLLGLGPGIVATLTSALIVDYWYLPPQGFGVENVADAVGLIFFLGMGALMSVVAESYRKGKEKLNEVMRRANIYNRSLIEASLDPLVTISREGKITDVNEATTKAIGIPRDELIGTDFSNYFTGQEKARKGYQQVFDKGFVSDYPLTLRHKDGKLIDVLYNATVYKDDKGDILGVFAAARDVTIQKQAEAELEKYRHHLEELVKERTSQLQAENAERKKAEERARRQNTVLQGINRVLDAALTCKTEEELGRVCLIVAEDVTQSKFGFIGEINAKGRLDDIAISDPGWTSCRMAIPTGHTGYKTVPGGFEIHGIYGRVLKDGKGFFTNDPSSQPDSIGVPAGHPPLTAFLGVPLVDAGRTIGMIAMGNRKGGYRPEDQEALEVLAPAIIGALQSKRSEEELRQTHDYLESLFNYANAPIICWDAKFKITRFNRAFEHLTDYKTEEVLGKELSMLFPKASREESLNRIQGTLSGVRWEVVEIPILRKDGTVRIALWNSANVYANDGKTILAIIAQGQDITERKKAEEALRQTHDYLESLFNYANAPIICWDAKFKITRFNRAFEHLTNYHAEEVLGKDLTILFPRDSKKESLNKIQLTLTGEHWEVVEVPILRKDGTVRIALWNSANVYANDGKTILATIAQGQDITERNITQEELRRSNENLEQFAYVASHDLQEPLRVMASYSELLGRRYKSKLDSDADDFIGFIVDAAKRMQKLIEDLLAYSRVGRVGKVLEEIDCNFIVDRIIKNMDPSIKNSSARITHDTLPIVAGNESNFFQLFQNLVGNAMKFHGAEPPRIHIGAVKKGREWLFSIKDNGIGIEPQYKDRIFIIFQRLHGKDQYPGTGIGLAICKKIVETGGGRIWVESEPGKGSTFYFTVPEKASLLAGREE